MKRLRPLVLALLVAALAGLAAWVWWPEPGGRVLTGYVEAETLYAAMPTSGAVQSVAVRRGERVAAGQPLFAVDPAALSARRAQAAGQLAAARAAAANTRKGQRPTEVAVSLAQRQAAEAELRRARAELDRTRALTRKGIYAPARLDAVEASHDAAAANVRALAAQTAVRALPARADEIAAADAQVEAARAALAEADQRLSELSTRAPAAGRVEEVYYQAGEWAAANQPVVALLPDGRLKLRFFVPQGEVARYRPGRTVAFACDGCPKGMTASVTFVSPRAEFTPPVIYSRGSRERLVFQVEAVPSAPADLPPGLPVDVVPLEG